MREIYRDVLSLLHIPALYLIQLLNDSCFIFTLIPISSPALISEIA